MSSAKVSNTVAQYEQKKGATQANTAGSVPVAFQWKYGGQSVFVTGTFDNWAATTPLKRAEDGTWKLTLNVNRQQKQLYKFVVDGQWVFDMSAPHEQDAQGNTNNVLEPVKSAQQAQKEEVNAPSTAVSAGKQALANNNKPNVINTAPGPITNNNKPVGGKLPSPGAAQAPVQAPGNNSINNNNNNQANANKSPVNQAPPSSSSQGGHGRQNSNNNNKNKKKGNRK